MENMHMMMWEIEDMKKTQMEILEMKNVISEMKKYTGWKKQYKKI